jgi:hypothetical protein
MLRIRSSEVVSKFGPIPSHSKLCRHENLCLLTTHGGTKCDQGLARRRVHCLSYEDFQPFSSPIVDNALSKNKTDLIES